MLSDLRSTPGTSDAADFTETARTAVHRLLELWPDGRSLATRDPYAIWSTRLGLAAKRQYHSSSRSRLMIAAPLAVWDVVTGHRGAPNPLRQLPIVQAQAALSNLAFARATGSRAHVDRAERCLEWLLDHASRGYSGLCWGLGFASHPDDRIEYRAETPLITITAYAFKAFVEHAVLTGSAQHQDAVQSIVRHIRADLVDMHDSEGRLATSYGPWADRIVNNAVSYNMVVHALAASYLNDSESDELNDRARRMYRYVKEAQQANGSWPYRDSVDSMIDCFHSCFVIKNIIHASRMADFEGSLEVVEAGYDFLKRHLVCNKTGLMLPFARHSAPFLVKYRLYDSAEMIGIAGLLGDWSFASALQESVEEHFGPPPAMHVEIDRVGRSLGRGYLRWGIMPYVLARATCLLELGQTSSR